MLIFIEYYSFVVFLTTSRSIAEVAQAVMGPASEGPGMVHYTQTWLPLLSFALIAAVVYLLSSFIAGGAEFLPHITKAATGLPLASASMTLNHDNESHSGAAGPTFLKRDRAACARLTTKIFVSL